MKFSLVVKNASTPFPILSVDGQTWFRCDDMPIDIVEILLYVQEHQAFFNESKLVPIDMGALADSQRNMVTT
ncbi:MAG: hypothetical protein HKP58_05155 [Desulfatitalea sp.]|nr:hypothetical protein [Desulfatitalea sp.]NNJ99781.1 hypothetical protein [Desulfatitalea sp.]